MQNLILVLLAALLCAASAPYVVRGITNVIHNWSRTTTVFFMFLTVIVLILLVARNVT